MKNSNNYFSTRKRGSRFFAKVCLLLLVLLAFGMTSFAQTLHPFTVSVKSETVTFDGRSHTLSTPVYQEGTLRAGDYVKSVIIAPVSYIAAGTYQIAPTKVVIEDGAGNDVTDLYDLTLNPGTLTINHAENKIKISATAKTELEAVYNGKLQQLTGFDSLKFNVDGVIYTLSGLQAVSQGTNVGVYETEFSGTPVVKIGDVDVTEECDVTMKKGSMGIIPAELHLFLDSTITYNAEKLSVAYDEFIPGTTGSYYVNGLVEGDYLTAGEVKTRGEDVGTYIYSSINGTNTSELIVPFTTNNGIENYLVFIECSQKIVPLSVVDTVRGENYTGVYDGQTHQVEGYSLSANTTLFNQSDVKYSGNSTSASRLVAGKTDMMLRSSQFYCANSNFDVAFYVIDGFVQIDPKEIGAIVTKNATKKYDGQPLNQPEYTFDETTLLEGDELIVVMEDAITDAGQISNTVKSYSIKHGTIDVTESYRTPEITEGHLTVTPRNITVQTADSMKKYDGVPLTAPRYKISGDGFVEGESMTLDFSKTSQTEVGVTFNVYKPVFTEGTNPDNYFITNQFGQLNVIGPFKANCWPQPLRCHNTSTGWVYFFGEQGLLPYEYKFLKPGDSYNSVEFQTMTGDAGNINNLSPNVRYKLYMRDALGSIDSSEFQLADVPELVIDSISVQGTSCNGSSGSAKVYVSGGTPISTGDSETKGSYFYEWSNGSPKVSASNLKYNQTYSVTVKDDNGCTVSGKVTIPLDYNINIKDFSAGTYCANSINWSVTPKNEEHGVVPSGIKYYWDAPVMQPADAQHVIGVSARSQADASSSFSTGNIRNNSGQPVTLIYTVNAVLSDCTIPNVFKVTINIASTNIDHQPITLQPLQKYEICNQGGPLDLIANFGNLGETADYTLRWNFNGEISSRQISGGEHRTADTLHVMVPETDCKESYIYYFSLTDENGCSKSDSSIVLARRGEWSIDETAQTFTVACLEDAVAPHLQGSLPVVTDDCGNVVPYTYNTYNIGETRCDMYIYHDYIYKACNSDSKTLSYIYHVKDTIAPTLSKEFTETIKAKVQDCVFYTPNLYDTIMAIVSDNCWQKYMMSYSQTPESGSVLEGNTNVVAHVTDNCGNTGDFPVAVAVNDSIKITLENVDSHCYNVSDGEIHGTFSGGIPPYSVTWKSEVANSGAAYDAPGAFSFVNLPDGHYSISVLSADGCRSKDTLQVDVVDRDEPFIITAKSETRAYNGKVLSNAGYDTTGTLIPGDELFVTVEGSILNAGTANNKITSVKIMRGDVDVTCEYNLTKVSGILTVTCRKIVLTSADASKPYDGTPLTNHTVTITSGDFAEGEGVDSYNVGGTRTLVGTTENEFVYTLKSNTNPDNYNITRRFGALTVTKAPEAITVVAKGAEKIYDGTPLTEPVYTYTGTLREGDTLIAETEGSQTVVGKSYNVIKSFRIMRGDEDVTDCYVIEPRQMGTLNVLPRPVTVKAGSLTKEYDGVEHTWEEIPTNERWTITAGSLADNQTLTADLTGKRTIPGSTLTYVDESTITITDADGESVIGNYKVSIETGNITITSRDEKYPLVIVSATDSTTYTGAVQTLVGFDTLSIRGTASRLPNEGLNHGTDLSFTMINENGVEVPYTLTGITSSQSQRNAGTYPMNITGTPKVIDAEGNDVTSEFDITERQGKFIIKPLPGLIITIKDTKPYDGTVLTSGLDKVVKVEGLGSADKLSAGTMVTANPAIGTYTYGNTDADWASNIGTDFKTTGGIQNYQNVTYIVEQEITTGIQMMARCPDGDNATHVYDGQPFAPKPEVIKDITHDEKLSIVEYRLEGSDIWYESVPSLTNVGSQKVYVRVTHPYYETRYCEYTFSVTPRPVTLTSATQKWIYDGTVHSAPTVKVTSGSFAEGEGATYDVTASIQNAGNCKNEFTYTLNSNTKATNYTINTVFGKLTVDPRPITITSLDSTRLYIENEALIQHKAKVTSTMNFVNGDYIDYVFTGTQTYPGWSDNNFEEGAFHGTGISVRGNYNITLVPGKLTVTENNELVIASLTDTVEFDGKHHTDTIFAATIYGRTLEPDPNDPKIFHFIDNNNEYNTLYITPTADIVNVGETQATFTWKIINDVTGNENTSCYTNVEIKDTGKVVVIPVPLKITIVDSKVYDKKVLTTTYSRAAVKAIGLVEGDKLTAGAAKTISDTVDVYTYVYKYDKENPHPVYPTDAPYSKVSTAFKTKLGITNYVVSYDFKQTITKSPELVVNCPTGNSITKMYDGTFLHPTATATGITGDVFKIEYSTDETTWGTKEPGITHVSESPLKVYVRASNNNYDTATCNYTLTITPRTITVTSATDQKEYDKTPLTNSTVTVTSKNKWVGEEGANYSVTGTITEVGSTSNDFTIASYFANTQSSDYKVTLKPGTLTITPSDELKVACPTGAGLTKQYDGTAINPAPTATYSGNYAGDVITIEYSADNGTTWSTTAPTITHVAESKTIKVRATNGNYVTDECSYELTITPRPITILSGTDSKEYDGTPLSKKEVTVTAGSFVEGESLTYDKFSTRKDVGTIANDYTYAAGANTQLTDYEVTKQTGTLTITPSDDITLTCPETGSAAAKKVYDGTALNPTATALGINNAKVTVQYSLNGTKWSSTVPSILHAGTQKVYVRTNDANYVTQTCDYTLEISKRPITITADNNSKEYDGTALTDDGWMDVPPVPASTDEVSSVTVTGSQTEVGESDNTPSGAVIICSATKENVVDDYDITYALGTLTVTDNKKGIEISSATEEWVYDGTIHTKPVYTVKYNGVEVTTVDETGKVFTLSTGDKITITPTTSGVTFIDENTPNNNTFTYVLDNDDMYKGERTITYGTLSIKKRPVTIIAGSDEKVYDGTALTENSYTIDKDTPIPATDNVSSVTVTGSRTHVGTSDNVASNAIFMHGTKDVTDNYIISYEEGDLTIKKRPLHIIADSGEKEYDGKPLEVPTYKLDENTPLATGDAITSVDITGAQTEVGSSANPAANAKISHNGTEDATDDYEITYDNGLLTVNNSETELVITSNNCYYEYDATERTCEDYTVTYDGVEVEKEEGEGNVYILPTGDKLTIIDPSKLTDVDTVTNDYGYILENEEYYWNLITEQGELGVYCRPVTVTAKSKDFTYDGAAHTYGEYEVTGLLGTDAITATVDGSIQFPGEKANTVTDYSFTSGKEINYCVTLQDGKLTMDCTTQNLVITAGSDTWEYDGTDHTSQAFKLSVNGGTAIEVPATAGGQYVFANGDTLTVTFDGTIRNVASSPVTNMVNTWKVSHNGTDVSSCYNVTKNSGLLNVTCRALTITGDTAAFVYDGQVHSSNVYHVYGLIGTDAVTAVVEGSIQYKNQSPVANVVKSYNFTSGVASNYCVTTIDGLLTMGYDECIALTVTAYSGEWNYDGQEHASDGYILTYGGDDYQVGADGVYTFSNGDVLTVNVTGSIKNVGSQANVPTVVSILNNTTDVSSAYCVTLKNGTLTVIPNVENIVITSATKEWVYDGESHTEQVYTVTYAGETLEADATGKTFTLPTGDKITITPTNAGDDGVITIDDNIEKNNTFAYVLENNDMYTGKRDTTFGTLSIAKRPLIIIADSDEKEYDGTPLTKDVWFIDESTTLATGDKVDTVTVTGSQTEVGSSDNVPSAAVILNNATDTVTKNYIIEYKNGKLTVEDNTTALVIKSNTCMYEYDATERTCEDYTVTYNGVEISKESGDDYAYILPTGDKITITDPASQTDVDTISNQFEYTLTNADNYKNVEVEYGELGIYCKPVTVTAKSKNFEYDGAPHTYGEYEVEGLLGTDAISAVVEGTVQFPGEVVANKVTSYTLTSGKEINYCVTLKDGELTIGCTPQSLVITAGSNTWEYDGTDHVQNSYYLSINGGEAIEVPATANGQYTFDNGDVLKVTLDGTIRNVASSPVTNTVTAWTLTHGTTDVSGCYEVTSANGKLNVICRPVKITGDTAEFAYDGAAHSSDKYNVYGLVGTDKLTAVVEGSIQYVDQSPVANVVKSHNFLSGTAGNYCVEYVPGKLTMVYGPCVALTVTANTDEWNYDGQEHANDGYTLTYGGNDYQVGADGVYTFANGDVLTVDVTGSIKNVGVQDNVPTVVSILNNTHNVADAYCVTPVNGKLTVKTNVENIVITSATKEWVYDGESHTEQVYTVTYGGETLEADATGKTFTLPTGDKITITPTNAGDDGVITIDDNIEKNNTFTYVLENNDMYTGKRDTTFGTLSIAKRPLIIIADSDEKEYDGTPLTKDAWSIDASTTLATGDKVDAVTVTGSQTEVGSSDNVPSAAVILNNAEDEVTKNYAIEYRNGKLTVTPNTTKITVASATKEWMYDGTLHTEEVYTVTYGDETLVADATGKVFTLPTGDKLTITPTTEGVEYYSEDYDKNNTFTYVLEHNDMYTGKRDTTFGTLSIIKRPITIIADDAEKNYDGTPLTKDSWTLDSSKPLATGDAVESVVITGSQTEVGSSDNVPSDAVIMQGTTKDVTDCYLISYVNGKLTVYPKLEIVSVDVTNVTCKDANDGKVTINVQGGKPVTPKYSYTITGPANFNGTTDGEISLVDLKPGEYNVKITDALDSTASATFTVTEPELLVAVITVPTEATDLCPNQGSYPVSVTVTGGTKDYTYAWSGDAANVNADATTVAQQGTKDCDHEYTVNIEVTDAHACVATAVAKFTVQDKVAPTFTTPKDTTLCRNEVGEIVKDVTITGTVKDAADNCTSKDDLMIEFEDQLVSGDQTTNMVYDRKWTVTDKCGNVTVKTQEITIRPSILTPGNYDFTCPQPVEVILPHGDCEMWVNIGYPEFMNHMTGMKVEITNDAPEGQIFQEGTTIVTWTATDECDAYIECQQTIIVKFPECPDAVDYEGNVYHGIRIGCDCWTQRNLESNKYSDGTDIPDIYNYESPEYPDVDDNVEKFGRLYDWESAIKDGADNGYGHVQGICPEGWYLPTDEKYAALNEYGADALKSPLYWIDGGGSNTTGFTALPAGYYNGTVDKYLNLMGEAHFWSTTKVGDSFAPRSFVIGYECNDVIATDAHSGLGYSVRCIKEKE